MKLNELEDIPIKTHSYTPKAGTERIEREKIEPDRSIRFNPNDYKLKTGKLSASSLDQLDTKVDEFLDKTKNRMSMVYNIIDRDDEHFAYIVYYDRDVSKLDGKYKTSLQTKIEEFAKKNSKDDKSIKTGNQSSLNNIQKTIQKLSDETQHDLLLWMLKNVK